MRHKEYRVYVADSIRAIRFDLKEKINLHFKRPMLIDELKSSKAKIKA